MNIMKHATTDVAKVAPGSSIDMAISLMEERRIHHLVVSNEHHVVGMLSDRDVLISTGWMMSVERESDRQDGPGKDVIGPTLVKQIMSQPAMCLTTADTARDVASLMLEWKIGAVPILNQNRLAGLITETDLVKWPPLCEIGADRVLNDEVCNLMRAHVLSVTPDAPLGEVIHLFRDRRIRHAPVAVHGRLVGIISDRDVRRALGWESIRDMQAECEGRLIATKSPRTAEDIMHEAVWTVGPHTPLRDALRLMLDERIHSLPVIEAQILKGIITQTDFIRAFKREGIY